MAHPPENSSVNSPLAPSVEKAYYRKCIELKRRLNEVEIANDEAKIRRVRLDRGIMKMRLERAFLLDELRKRMDYTMDGSEGSEEEGMATQPPPDRPHRDKRRRPETSRRAAHPAAATSVPSQSSQRARGPSQSTRDRVDSTPVNDEVSAPADAVQEDKLRQEPPSDPPQAREQSPSIETRGSITEPAEAQINGSTTNGADEEPRDAPINRTAGATGEALSAGPLIKEDANGERVIVPSASGEDATSLTEPPEMARDVQ